MPMEDAPQFRIGERQELGRYVFTPEAIVAFAEKFDPQPFHVDAEAGRRSHFGALVASGWHTLAVWMGFFVRAHPKALPDAAPDDPTIISPAGVGFGFAEHRWIEPVRAGDEIFFFTRLEEARVSANRPGWGVFRRLNSACRADGAEVLTFRLNHISPVGTSMERIRQGA